MLDMRAILPIPAGRYEAKICFWNENENGAVLTFEITAGPQKGRLVMQNITSELGTAYLAAALAIEPDSFTTVRHVLDACVGKQATIVVQHRVSDGKIFSIVERVNP